MRPKIADEVLTQAFKAATVLPDAPDPFVEVTDDGEVDRDPTQRMSRLELDVILQVCAK
jgi:hypothetical protein